MHFSCFPIDLADLTQPFINNTETSPKKIVAKDKLSTCVHENLGNMNKMMQSIMNQFMLQIIVTGSLFFIFLNIFKIYLFIFLVVKLFDILSKK
jgi:hypothetical protein